MERVLLSTAIIEIIDNAEIPQPRKKGLQAGFITEALYQLNTVTYGTASALYLATRCPLELVKREIENYPIE